MQTRKSIPFVVFALAGALALTVLLQRHPADSSAPVTGSAPLLARDSASCFDAPDFIAVDQDGRAFAARELRGKVWIADFIFTGCAGVCPVLTQKMATLQRDLAASPIDFVSFDVDPDHDTPAKLNEYGQTYHADFSNWHFLALPSWHAAFAVAKGMRATTATDDRDFQLLHSDHFLLVDADGRVRGVYDMYKPASMGQLASDARALLRR